RVGAPSGVDPVQQFGRRSAGEEDGPVLYGDPGESEAHRGVGVGAHIGHAVRVDPKRSVLFVGQLDHAFTFPASISMLRSSTIMSEADCLASSTVATNFVRRMLRGA